MDFSETSTPTWSYRAQVHVSIVYCNEEHRECRAMIDHAAAFRTIVKHVRMELEDRGAQILMPYVTVIHLQKMALSRFSSLSAPSPSLAVADGSHVSCSRACHTRRLCSTSSSQERSV